MNGFDVAAYCSDSISIWPCGIAVNADSKSDVRHCSCPICANVRTAVAAPKQISRQEYEELIRTASALLAVCGFKLNLIPDVESDDDQKSVTASGEITNIP